MARRARARGRRCWRSLACSAPLLAAGSWLVTGIRGPVAVSSGPVLPAFVSVSSDNGMQLRTLVLRSGPGQLTYAVLRGADPLIGATELAEPPAARRALDTAVAALVAPGGGDAQDQGQAMASFDIGYVLLPAPVDGGLARVLDGVPGLRPVSTTSAFELWRVAETTARVRVVPPTGTVIPVVSGPVAVSACGSPHGRRDPGARRAGRRLDRHAGRSPADAAGCPGRRLGTGFPPAAGRRTARRHPQSGRP